MENSDHNKKQTVSEKSLKEWKLPPSSASDFVSGRRGCFSFLPDLTVNTVEKSIPLSKGFSTFPLFSKHNTRLYQLLYGFVHVGMIQVALKPTKLGSNASATVCLRDERMKSYRDSILGQVESSLSDGPIYFSYFPNHCVALSDSHVCFTIDVKIRGKERVTLMYKFHYEVMKWPGLYDVSRYGVDERGETTMYITKIAENNRVVSRKIRWDRIGAGEEEVGYENEEASSAPVGGTNVDWKETAEAHVLKVDVPGLEIEQVKVEVEDGRVLVISGDRGEEEEDKGKWHCVERRSGKFLRRMRLPENANMDQLTAAMKSGVLTVTIPKEEVVQNSKVKIISISGERMSLIPSFFGNRRSNVFDPFSLDIWDPFEGFPLSSAVANLPSSAAETTAVANARIDWKETPDAHVFKVDVPGLKKEEVKVEVEDGSILQISGERSKEQEEKNDKWHRVERSSGKFLRRFRLPESAKLEQVKAAMENGVLTVTVPKEEVKKLEVKAIDISG